MTADLAALGALSLTPVVQRLRDERIDDLGPAIEEALERGRLLGEGERVAVAVGSRGIDRIAEVTRLVVAGLRRRGAEPFVLPAMGSHGGARAAGQEALLATYGVSEAQVGAPVVSSMETVLLEGGRKAHFDRLAAAADGVVVVNRVKPHSSLTGDLGSGLAKMTAVGLGKHAGAQAIHAAGLAEALIPTAETLLEAAPIMLGIALVEDAFDQIAVVEGVAPERFVASDRRLLGRARASLPTIPFESLDGVVFVWMGKNISGTGMDPNVVGMHRRNGGPPDRRIGTLAALRLTAESHGNALGIGLADVVPASLVAGVDAEAMRANAETTRWEAGARIPPTLATEAEVIARVCGGPPATVRAVLAEDSAHLDRLLVTPALLPAVEAAPTLEVAGAARRLSFDEAGRLTMSIR